MVEPSAATVVISAPKPAILQPELKSPALKVRVVVISPEEPVTVFPSDSLRVASVPNVSVCPFKFRSPPVRVSVPAPSLTSPPAPVIPCEMVVL